MFHAIELYRIVNAIVYLILCTAATRLPYLCVQQQPERLHINLHRIKLEKTENDPARPPLQ